MVDLWHLAMVLVLPLLVAGSDLAIFQGRRGPIALARAAAQLAVQPKASTWLIIVGANALATLLWLVGIFNVFSFVLIDMIAATLVLTSFRTLRPPPETIWERAIGAAFIAMAFFGIGFLLSGGAALEENVSANSKTDWLVFCYDSLSWLQWLLLLGWPTYELWKRNLDRRDTVLGEDPSFERGGR